MEWEVEYTDQFGDWWDSLDGDDQEAIFSAVRLLRYRGPSQGRPMVDTIKQSRHKNMKELRLGTDGAIRILFAFDPRRHAILLIGGDKAGRWNDWYNEFIPIADDLYDEHLEALRKVMSGHKPFSNLTKDIERDPVRMQRVRDMTRAYLDAERLMELRSHRNLTQREVADALGVSQANVSRIEHEDDVYLSTLRAYIEALGGELEITARFPDGEVLRVG